MGCNILQEKGDIGLMNSVPERIIGLDLGDRWSKWVELNREGEEVSRGRIRTTKKAMCDFFSDKAGSRVALEAGTHSGWVSRLLIKLGCEVLVANSRQIPMVTEQVQKSDYLDAEMLARLARFDPKLLKPIRHREEEQQRDLVLLHVREQLVRNRTDQVNAVRGHLKQFGARAVKCDPSCFAKRVREQMPEELKPVLGGLLVSIQCQSDRIRELDRQIEQLCQEKYPETELLRQIRGVGALTALAFVLCLQSPEYFASNRKAGAYLGLVPRLKQTGESDPQLRITKAGNEMMRRLLVQSAHYILGPFGVDSDLRRHGEKLAAQGGKRAKKRAAVAVARKLAVLLLCFWRTGQVYEPLYNAQGRAAA